MADRNDLTWEESRGVKDLTPDRGGEVRRSAMFFEGDVYSAAETAAYELECHGLTPEQTQELAEQLGDVIRSYFEKAR